MLIIYTIDFLPLQNESFSAIFVNEIYIKGFINTRIKR